MTTNPTSGRTRLGALRTGELPSSVIHAGERFMAPRPMPSQASTTGMTASVIRPDFKNDRCPAEKVRRRVGPSVKRLPFVTVKGGSRRARAVSYWNDVPTRNGRDDFKRGKKYAALTIEAMTADGCASWYLEKIIEAIVADAVSRKVRGGKHSRTLPPAVDGFIHELSRKFCATFADVQPAN